MDLNSVETELNSQLSKKEFVLNTCRQINKDLTGISDFKIEISDELFEFPKVNITQQLLNIAHLLLKKNNLQQFLYKIDLSEAKSKNFYNGVINLESLCNDIVKREALKVYLKEKFK